MMMRAMRRHPPATAGLGLNEGEKQNEEKKSRKDFFWVFARSICSRKNKEDLERYRNALLSIETNSHFARCSYLDGRNMSTSYYEYH